MVSVVLECGRDGMTLRADRDDRPFMAVFRVRRDVLALPTDTKFATFLRCNPADNTAIVEPLPHGVEIFAHRVVGTRLLIVLFQIKDAEVSPRHARLALPADDLLRAIIRVVLHDDLPVASVTRALTSAGIKLCLSHESRVT